MTRHLALALLVAPLLVALPTAASAAPDLVVEDIALTPANPAPGDGTLEVIFKNVGADDVSLPWTEYTNYQAYLDGNPCDDGFIGDLDAGETNLEDISDCVPDAPGAHVIRVVIDSDSDVSEANEANNERSETFTWGGPDLRIKHILPMENPAIAGEGGLQVAFENIGSADVDLPLTTFTNYAAYRNGVLCDDGWIEDLAAGDTNDERIDACIPDAPGDYSIRVVIDTEGEVTELDETNNTLEIGLTWGGPDLIVKSITPSDPAPVPGEGDLKVVFENIGAADVDVSLITYTTYTAYRDGEECDDGWIFDLDAGDTNEEDISACIPSAPGDYVIKVFIDSEYEVAEEDETNNTLEQTIGWGDPCAGPELCNGADDDCDGDTDEIFPVGQACTPEGVDCAAVYTCSADGHGVDCLADTSAPELCNDLDDDCDGDTDEGFTGLGEACQVTVDGCSAGGTRECSDDGAAVVCVSSMSDADELCDGLDNDCDGETDEPFLLVGTPCQAGLGACETWGSHVCSAGGLDCDAAPTAGAPETCGNRVDDDCDGAIDEGCPCAPPGTIRGCGPNAGVCSAGGKQVCSDLGYWEPCTGDDVYAPETCDDGVDDDCDGKTDENCAVDPGCVPDCVARECGSDGCGGYCGSCDLGETCTSAGLCEGTVAEPEPDADTTGGEADTWVPDKDTAASADTAAVIDGGGDDNGGCAGGGAPSSAALALLVLALAAMLPRRRRI